MRCASSSVLDAMDRSVHGIATGNEDVGGVDHHAVFRCHGAVVHGSEAFQLLDLITEEMDPNAFIGISQEHFHHIAAHSEVAPAGFGIFAAV